MGIPARQHCIPKEIPMESGLGRVSKRQSAPAEVVENRLRFIREKVVPVMTTMAEGFRPFEALLREDLSNMSGVCDSDTVREIAHAKSLVMKHFLEWKALASISIEDAMSEDRDAILQREFNRLADEYDAELVRELERIGEN